MDTWTSSIRGVNERTPMQVANQFERRCRQKKRLAALVKKVNAECARLEQEVMDLMEAELLPPSFRGKLGSSIYTREETWASPLDGDHAALTAVLRDLGPDYAEYLPSNVNSQSLSSLVRNSWNEETEQYDLPPDLINVLKITRKPRVVSNG
jgi:hypothetical protein